MLRPIRPWITALAVLTLAITACGGSSAPTSSTAVPSGTAADPSAGVQPTDAPDPTDAAQPTDAPLPSGEATPAATGSDPDAGIPTDAALLGTGLVPEGWQIVEDVTQTCRIAVPGDWTTDIVPGAGQTSALAEGIAAVNVDAQEWDTFKQNVDQFYLSGHVTAIDTDDAFLIANPVGPDFNLAYLLGLRFDDVNCSVLVTIQRNGMAEYAAEAILIAQTLDHTD